MGLASQEYMVRVAAGPREDFARHLARLVEELADEPLAAPGETALGRAAGPVPALDVAGACLGGDQPVASELAHSVPAQAQQHHADHRVRAEHSDQQGRCRSSVRRVCRQRKWRDNRQGPVPSQEQRQPRVPVAQLAPELVAQALGRRRLC